MDPADYFTLYSLRPVRRAVALTTLVCLWYLVRLWWRGELYGAHLRIFIFWFATTLATLLATRSVSVWILGLLAQVALAIVLILKHQWTDSI